MGVVEARIQTVEDIYRLMRTAVAHKRPVRATYKNLLRLFCPHRLGRNRVGQLRVLCYQYGGESGPGADGFAGKLALRCTGKAQISGTVGWSLEIRAEPFASRQLRD